jgi:hypothetical protein
MLVSQAYNNFDKKKEIFNNFDLDNKDYKFIYSYDNINDAMPVIFNINLKNKTLLKGNCSIIGIYNNILSVWQWGWSMSFKYKVQNYQSRKLLLYALDIDPDNYNKNDRIIINILKIELLNSKLYLENPRIEIEKYIALSIYLIQGDYYYKEIIENYNVNTEQMEIVGEIYWLLQNIEIVNPP